MEITHVPHKGSSEARTSVMSGQVEIMIDAITTMTPLAKAGRVRALGSTGLKRSSVMPDLPTVEEAGFRGYDAGTWYGLFGPAKLPRGIVTTLHAHLVKAMATPGIKGRLQQQGADITLMAPDALAQHLERERGELVRYQITNSGRNVIGSHLQRQDSLRSRPISELPPYIPKTEHVRAGSMYAYSLPSRGMQ